jgi:hypothetical protein
VPIPRGGRNVFYGSVSGDRRSSLPVIRRSVLAESNGIELVPVGSGDAEESQRSIDCLVVQRGDSCSLTAEGL